MNGMIDMDNVTFEAQTETSQKTIGEIHPIVLLEKSKVTEETIGSNESHQCSLEETDQELVHDDDDNASEDENENTLNNARSDLFYKDAQQYWKQIPATIDGMLGGYSNINFTDIRGSQDFIKDVFKMKPSPNKNCALDCGAGMVSFNSVVAYGHSINFCNVLGIGRVTKHLLIPIFNTVDIVEQDEHFANSVREYVGNSSKLGTIYNLGLQEFHPKSMRYDVIWVQWVSGHLTNDDFVKFYERCSQALSKNGIVIVKENISSSENVVIDEVDSSVTRPLGMFKQLLIQSGFRIVKMVRQSNFPSAIFPVYMLALKPVKQNR